MLTATDIHIEAGGRRLLDGFSFSVDAGQAVLLQGPSGSGKSTLLKALLGFYPFQGKIEWFGQALTHETVDAVRDQTVYLPQHINLNFPSVESLILFPFTFRKNRKNRPNPATIREGLDAFGLDGHILQTPTEDISGGEMQRAILLSGVLQDKPVYLMDEPTAALDEALRQQIIPEIIKKKGRTVLVASHDTIWQHYADTKIHLKTP